MSDVEIPVPLNNEAEQALLGAVIQDARAFDDVRAMLSASDFYRPAHAQVWSVVEALRDVGKAVDPLAVMQALRENGELTRIGGGSYLHDLIATPWTSANVTYQARLVREASRARRALQINQRISQALIDNPADHERLLSALARQAIELEVLVDERSGLEPVHGLERWDDFLDRERTLEHRWIIPGLLRRQDVFMLLAGEGGGKTWFTRQFCMCISAGIHPFHPDTFIAPRTTLHIDLENPEDLVAEEGHTLRTQVKQLGGWRPDNAHIWHKPGGLDLRERKDAMLLERAIAETGAEVVSLGSLYKSFKRRGDSWDQAAEECRDVFDKIRERYGVAFILEHHMPKGDGGASFDRPQSPYGSQQWIGWCSLGRIINRVGDNMYRFDNFRGDRGERRMPLGLIRGGQLPWTPVWDREELLYGMWEEVRKHEEKRHH